MGINKKKQGNMNGSTRKNNRAFNKLAYVFYLLLICFSIMGINAYGQEVNTTDTAKVSISLNKTDTTQFQKDTLTDIHIDVSPLDIGRDRGIFILSSDKMMQLRILGSVRSNLNYSTQDLEDKQTFNPYDIPTTVETNSPNFFAGLEQTRLGFEVTRRTKTKGDIFIRIEGDFKNSYNSYRIRHAYGQFGRLLAGKTWTLFSNIAYQPAIVSMDGPAGGSGLRTPQVRYTQNINTRMAWSAAIEYSNLNIEVPDSLSGSLLQVIPDFTGRYTYNTDLLSLRAALVITTISGRKEEADPLNYYFGVGLSVAGVYKTNEKGSLYFSVIAGRAISHFMDMFGDKNVDVDYNPENGSLKALGSIGGYVAYSYSFMKKLSASATFGIAAIDNKDFQSDDFFNYAHNTLLNVFWEPVDGARAGIEFATGKRYDVGTSKGLANRFSILMYYDF